MDPSRRRLRGKVCRHWFTTLHSVPDCPAAAVVRPLPGDASTMGEWYLAVSARSVGVPIGLEMIRQLTSRVNEDQRARLGVGLPTRTSFYATAKDDTSDKVGLSVPAPRDGGRTWDVDRLGGLLKRSFAKSYRRSRIKGYARLAPILSAHIEELICIGVAGSPLTESELKLWRQSVAARLKSTLGVA